MKKERRQIKKIAVGDQMLRSNECTEAEARKFMLSMTGYKIHIEKKNRKRREGGRKAWQAKSPEAQAKVLEILKMGRQKQVDKKLENQKSEKK